MYLPQPQKPQTSASSSADRSQSQALTSSLCASRAWRLGEKVHAHTNTVELKTRHKPSFFNNRQKPCEGNVPGSLAVLTAVNVTEAEDIES